MGRYAKAAAVPTKSAAVGVLRTAGGAWRALHAAEKQGESPEAVMALPAGVHGMEPRIARGWCCRLRHSDPHVEMDAQRQRGRQGRLPGAAAPAHRHLWPAASPLAELELEEGGA